MLKINMEFKRGILFIRLEGSLNKRTTNKLSEEAIPVLLKSGIKYVVINFDKVNYLDKEGIDCLMQINELITNMHGRTTLCSLTNKNVKNILSENEYYNSFYETSNELTALGVINL